MAEKDESTSDAVTIDTNPRLYSKKTESSQMTTRKTLYKQDNPFFEMCQNRPLNAKTHHL